MVTTRAQAETPVSVKRRSSRKSLKETSTPNDAPTRTMSTKSAANGSAAKAKGKAALLAPKTEHYEFGGPLGALFVTTTVPFFSYALFYFCNEKAGCSILPSNPGLLFKAMQQGVVDSFFDYTGWAIYFGWYAFTVLCWALLPGKVEEGLQLRTGERLTYKTNAFATLVASFALSAGWIAIKGPAAYTFFYDHWPALITASLANSFIQAVYVYAASFQEGKLLAEGGNSGNVLYDWFIGRELNPRIGSFDIKTFNELRPGLILWALLDYSSACHQYVALGGRITASMVLVLIFHTFYVVDALYFESAIFSQMDITTDGFGFMLSVGDLTWVPFVYSLQARYLAFVPVELGVFGTLAIFAANFTGYYIFRTANAEKNDFRNGSNKKNLQYMTTESGRKLLTSGWWGRSRHPNYFGDWVMALSWSLPTGFTTPITYFYFAFFVVLLLHRQMRDDEACRKKYGKDWDVYCSKVPSRIIPGIY